MIKRLSVVDQSPISDGMTPSQALANTVDLAQQTEQFGYSRYWLAEHHSSVALAGSAPEILIGRVAAATTTLRVGAGGVMLTHYSSYKVAEQFRMLHALFPDRIDLGLGRAPGSDQTTAAALAKGPGALSSEHYPAQVTELRAFLRDEPDSSGPFRDVRATPITPNPPPIFLLGSSPGSAGIAAHLGLPLVWASFIARVDGQPIIEAYRAQYQPSTDWPEPTVMLATAAVCAETTQQAALLASSVTDWRAGGLQGAIPAPRQPGEAREPDNPLRLVQPAKPLLNGTPSFVKENLESQASALGAEEVFVITITHDHHARVRSYELLAEAFELG